MTTHAAKTGATFPVDWNSVDVPGTLNHDRMHFPHPLSPMTGSLVSTGFVYGHRKASREFHLGIRFQVVMVNHYRYDGVLPEQLTEAEAAARGRLTQEAVGQAMRRQLEQWQEEHLPLLEAMLRRLETIDPRDLPTKQQLALLDEVYRIQSDLWTVHFRIVPPMMTAMQLFGEFYSETIGGTAQDAQALLTGANSKSVAAGIALGDLANRARTLGLEPIFRKTNGDELLRALKGDAAGQEFLEQLDHFLASYGLRSDLFDLAEPTWREDPTIPLATIATYLHSGYDARGAHMEAAGQADAAVNAARERLAAYPEAVRQQFDTLLQAARHGAFLQEEHNFYIDQQGIALTRLALLRFGDELVTRGYLPTRQDMFMLTMEEAREIVALEPAPADTSWIRDLIARRRQELEAARAMEPPPFVGAPPIGPPDESNPGARAMLSFFGGPPKRSDDPSTILGNPGSRGSVTGSARVARTLADAMQLQAGEILVTTTTMPAWTPLFGIAAAVVTETGGSLSHCAIVAREYGIPAVVGAWGATRRIETGQEITVDGTQGVVMLL